MGGGLGFWLKQSQHNGETILVDAFLSPSHKVYREDHFSRKASRWRLLLHVCIGLASLAFIHTAT